MFARGIIVLLCVLVAISDGARVPKCPKYKPDACPKLYKPVCATNGVTYNNECLLCVAMWELSVGLLIEHDGECIPLDE